MNSFQIVQAKRALIAELSQRERPRMSKDECLEFLRAAGHRVNADALAALVQGSADSPLAFDGDQVLLNSPQ
jgi:hypothetical protein